jgi:hypothetical protein
MIPNAPHQKDIPEMNMVDQRNTPPMEQQEQTVEGI